MSNATPCRLQSLLLQQEAVSQLGHVLRGGRLQQTYLLTGAPSVGKGTLARAFAAALLCEHPDSSATDFPDACGQCDSCRRLETGSHPDVSIISPRGNEIRIQQVRTMQEDAQLKPALGSWRVFIIDPADRLNEFSANSLLKILEEAPPRVIFLLLASSPEGVLPTILSRSTRVPLRSPSFHEARQALTALTSVPAAQAAEALAICQGRLGFARRLLAVGIPPSPEEPAVVSPADLGHWQAAYFDELARLPALIDERFERSSFVDALWPTLQELLEQPAPRLAVSEYAFTLALAAAPGLPRAFPILFTGGFLDLLDLIKREAKKSADALLKRLKAGLPSAMLKELEEQFTQWATEFAQRRFVSLLEGLGLAWADGFRYATCGDEEMLLNIGRKDIIMKLAAFPGSAVLESRLQTLERSVQRHRRYIQPALILENILTDIGGPLR
ncbi:MAG TPA: DNA polymerase III subunit delta' [Candidatus Ozemobacteraceae bacterium]|nr:DNA polymerase III subunit delta' [Candidatus Ozemobacteraceae bacterium]